jgi:hypothetical protein
MGEGQQALCSAVRNLTAESFLSVYQTHPHLHGLRRRTIIALHGRRAVKHVGHIRLSYQS